MENLITLLFFILPILAVLAIGAFVSDYLIPKLLDKIGDGVESAVNWKDNTIDKIKKCGGGE